MSCLESRRAQLWVCNYDPSSCPPPLSAQVSPHSQASRVVGELQVSLTALFSPAVLASLDAQRQHCYILITLIIHAERHWGGGERQGFRNLPE